MGTRGYSIPDLVEDLRRVVASAKDERDILSLVRPLAQRAASARESWLDKRFYAADAEQGFGVYLLHEEPDHSLAVFAMSWLPGRGAPPHDHGTWAVVAGVDGPEKNEFFERVDDRSRAGFAELRKVGEKTFGVGDVLAMRTGQIHSVRNESTATSVSLHIYGKNVQHTGRSKFDIEKRTEMPFLVKVEPGGGDAGSTKARSSWSLRRTRSMRRRRFLPARRMAPNLRSTMTSNRRDAARASLRRMLANGRLTALPKRPADQQLLVAMAASRFDAERAYVESEVNERLKAWLETISEPFGIDHVTLRRLLVDSRMLTRTTSGSAYRLDAEKTRGLEAIRDLDPADILAQIRNERGLRKRHRTTG